MRIYKSILLSIFWIILGLALTALSAAGYLDSLFQGVGGGLALAGIVQLIRAVYYRTNEKYREKTDIACHDERNHYIRMKAWSWAGVWFVLLCSCAVFGFAALGKRMYMQEASLALCVLLMMYWTAYMVLKRKY